MNKITVIVLTKAQEAIADILALDSQDIPAVPVPEADIPAVPVPEADIPAVPVPEADAVLDSEGLPWDVRIHSSGKTFLARGGTWKLARGADSLLVAQVKTELRQAQGGDTHEVIPAPPVVPDDGAHEVIPAPPVVPDDGALTWAQLMEKIAEAETDPSEVVAACQKFNVANIGVLQDLPVLVPLVAKELGF